VFIVIVGIDNIGASLFGSEEFIAEMAQYRQQLYFNDRTPANSNKRKQVTAS
jgi:hypothetical protein